MSKPHKILIHAAFIHEARPLIQTLKLSQNALLPKIYENDHYMLIVSGMGEKNTTEILQNIFNEHCFTKAINIGIAGCSDEKIPVGTLLCCTHESLSVPYASITMVNEAANSKASLQTVLVDMESAAFLKVARNYLPKNECYVFKVVSDYCDSTLPKKSFVIGLIQQHIKTIKEFL